MEKDGGKGSLKGSNRYSVWQRHTFMSPPVTKQPERLQQNHGVHHVVAAIQAAFDGVVSAYPGRCRWSTSVAAIQAVVLPFTKGVASVQSVMLFSNCRQTLFYNRINI